jgi:hypothetical protein
MLGLTLYISALGVGSVSLLLHCVGLFWFVTFWPFRKKPADQKPLSQLLAFSRLPADRVLFEVGVHGATYRRGEVCGAEAFE